LLRDAAQGAADDAPLVFRGGGLRDELVDVYRQLASRIGGRAKGAELAGLLAAAERDPEVRASYHTFVLGQRRQVQTLLAAAVTFGELPPDTDLEVAVDLLAGPVFYRRLVVGASPDRSGYVESLIDIVLAGLGHRDGRSDSSTGGTADV
jgi:hypothetical protein